MDAYYWEGIIWWTFVTVHLHANTLCFFFHIFLCILCNKIFSTSRDCIKNPNPEEAQTEVKINVVFLSSSLCIVCINGLKQHKSRAQGAWPQTCWVLPAVFAVKHQSESQSEVWVSRLRAHVANSHRWTLLPNYFIKPTIWIASRMLLWKCKHCVSTIHQLQLFVGTS